MEDELDKILNDHQNRLNKTPLEDFDNLSPEDMFNLVYNPFQEGSLIQFKSIIDQETLDDIPFLNLIEYFLNKVESEGFIKLTSKGNLPTKLVKELYGLGLIKEELVERGISKLYKESDSLGITNMKIICQLSKLVKKKKGQLSLTKKGQNLKANDNRKKLLEEIFVTYGYKFNLGFHDLYDDKNVVQPCLGYTIFQLLKYGEEEKNLRFYTDKMIKAYPHILGFFTADYSTPFDQFESCYHSRFMTRFLNWFNFIESSEKRLFFNDALIKSILLDKVFEIKNENFKFRKEKFLA